MSRCPIWLLVVVISLAWADLAQAVTPAQEATRLKLATRMAVYYENRPLREVLGDIATQAGVEIVCDDASLRAEEVTPDTEVTMRIDGKISAKAALRVVLDQLRLTTIVRPDGIIEVVNGDYPVGLVEKVYQLSPSIRVATGNPQTADRTNEDDQLRSLELVTDLLYWINLSEWQLGGGWGTITSIENDSAILVNQSPKMHEVIRKHLELERRIREPRVVLTVEHLELDERAWRPLKRQRNAAGHSQISAARLKSVRDRPERLYSTRTYLLSDGELVDIPVIYKGTAPPGAVDVVQIQASFQKDKQLLIAVAPRSEGRERFTTENFAVVPAGESLLIPVTDNIPGTAIRFDEGTRHVLMLTPRVVPADSDENVVYTLRN